MLEFFESPLGRQRLLYARDADRSPEVQVYGIRGAGWWRNGWRNEELPGRHMRPVTEEYARDRWPGAFESEASDL